MEFFSYFRLNNHCCTAIDRKRSPHFKNKEKQVNLEDFDQTLNWDPFKHLR